VTTCVPGDESDWKRPSGVTLPPVASQSTGIGMLSPETTKAYGVNVTD